jgi:hypothetical protein
LAARTFCEHDDNPTEHYEKADVMIVMANGPPHEEYGGSQPVGKDRMSSSEAPSAFGIQKCAV